MDIHIILQGKSGVGKSFISSVLTQHLQSKGQEILCIDTDPVNKSFSRYKAFEAVEINLMEDNEINSRKFDELVDLILKTAKEEKTAAIVIDNGASSFVPFSAYILESGIIRELVEMGHSVNLHTIITGGQAQQDTLLGFKKLTNEFNVPIIVWLNNYFGTTKVKDSKTGKLKDFEEIGLFKKNSEKIQAIVKLPKIKKETFGKDVEEMLSSSMTFDQADKSSMSFMCKQRLRMYWRNLQEILEGVNL